MKLKTDVFHGASADAIFLAIVKFAAMLSGLVVTRLLAQFFSKYDYGTYSQIILLASTVSSLTILGMMDAVNYFFCYERDIKKRESYVATIFLLQGIVSLAAAVIVLSAGGIISKSMGNSGVKHLLVFAVILPFLQNLALLLQVLIVAGGKAKLLAIKNLANACCRLLFVYVVCLFFKKVAFVLVITVLLDIGQILFFIIMLKRINCHISLTSADLSLTKNILSYSIPMAVSIMINSLNRDLDKYVITLFTDTEVLALYMNASKQLPFDLVMSSFITVLCPYITRLISKREYSNAAELYKNFLEISYISTAIIGFGALVISPELMRLLYSEKYMSGFPIFSIYIFVDILRFTNTTLILSAAGKTKKLMFLALSMLAGNLIMDITMFRLVGIAGPAIATLFITLLLGILMLRSSASEIGQSIRDFFDYKYLSTFLLESVLALAGMSFVRIQLKALNMHYIITLFVGFGGYCIILVLLNYRRFLSALHAIERYRKFGASVVCEDASAARESGTECKE